MFKNIHRCGYEVNSENKINLDDLISGNIFRKLKSSCLPCHISLLEEKKEDLLKVFGLFNNRHFYPKMITDFYFCNWNVSYTCGSEFVIYEKCI